MKKYSGQFAAAEFLQEQINSTKDDIAKAEAYIEVLKMARQQILDSGNVVDMERFSTEYVTYLNGKSLLETHLKDLEDQKRELELLPQPS